MNGVYSRMFGDHRPARTTIQAAGLPGDGLRVEIDCIAYVRKVAGRPELDASTVPWGHRLPQGSIGSWRSQATALGRRI